MTTPFPGDRPANVTLDPQRDGDTNARKVPFPTGAPATVTSDPLRDGLARQDENVDEGGEFGESGVFGAMDQGAEDPEHKQSEDSTNLEKPSAPTAVVGTKGSTTVSVAFTPGTVPGDTYTVVVSPGGATASGTSSPIVVTGLTNGTAYTATVHGTNDHGDGVASTASAAFTPS